MPKLHTTLKENGQFLPLLPLEGVPQSFRLVGRSKKDRVCQSISKASLPIVNTFIQQVLSSLCTIHFSRHWAISADRTKSFPHGPFLMREDRQTNPASSGSRCCGGKSG